jgi:hypothetical protein
MLARLFPGLSHLRPSSQHWDGNARDAQADEICLEVLAISRSGIRADSYFALHLTRTNARQQPFPSRLDPSQPIIGSVTRRVKSPPISPAFPSAEAHLLFP